MMPHDAGHGALGPPHFGKPPGSASSKDGPAAEIRHRRRKNQEDQFGHRRLGRGTRKKKRLGVESGVGRWREVR